MSRTYRRHGQHHDYRWVLCNREWINHVLVSVPIDARAKERRRAVARFHSDAESTVHSSAPHWYRRFFDNRLRTLNFRQLRRWIEDHDYDPVFLVRHRHNANWNWW